jgi:hypothetical protein
MIMPIVNHACWQIRARKGQGTEHTYLMIRALLDGFDITHKLSVFYPIVAQGRKHDLLHLYN